ncbi:MAG TPA: hypothetical protein VGR37_05540 [Longimicrobiaceae bacterium]|nr:hypothetical protein [Longimicrobiaceae bacterium]
MYFTTIVKLTVDDESSQPIRGVKVALFDRDRLSRDDHLGSATTDENGEARFQYSAAQFDDLDERIGGAFPELYAVVSDAADKQVISTRAEALNNSAPKHIAVRIARDVALRHSLLPREMPA